MAKSEKQRQKAAHKKKRRAREKSAQRTQDSRTKLMSCLRNVATLSTHSGDIVGLLKQGLTPVETAERLGIKTEEVDAVLTAFHRVPHGIKEIVMQTPEALRNPKLFDSLLAASKRVKRNKLGGIEFGKSDLSYLQSLLKEGREQMQVGEERPS